MLKVFLCEDNDHHRVEIEKCIRNIILIENLDMNVELVTSEPNDLINKIEYLDGSGVYFLDIDLNSDLNGLQLAEIIREYDPRGFIIFITSHSEMTYLTFQYKVEAMDFIVKNNIKIINERIAHCLLEASKRYSAKRNKFQDVFTINLGDKLLTFEYDSILFFETSPNVHKLILHTLDKEVEFYGKLKDVETIVDNRFIRVHKSFLVNKNNIEEVNKVDKIIHMKGGKVSFASVRLIKNLIN